LDISLQLHMPIVLPQHRAVLRSIPQTTGFTGADLANLVNEAALLAGRGNKGVVSTADFDSAVLRAVAGIEKKRSLLQVCGVGGCGVAAKGGGGSAPREAAPARALKDEEM
jgi:hypothetical protein